MYVHSSESQGVSTGWKRSQPHRGVRSCLHPLLYKEERLFLSVLSCREAEPFSTLENSVPPRAVSQQAAQYTPAYLCGRASLSLAGVMKICLYIRVYMIYAWRDSIGL